MLDKYPIYVGGINTKVVTPAATDLTPITEVFMQRAAERARRTRSAGPTKETPTKLDATYGEGLARQQRIDLAMGTINYYRSLYGPEMENVVNAIPEVVQSYSVIESEHSEGRLNAYKQTQEMAKGYRDRIGKDKAGDQFATQYLHAFGMGDDGPVTYGKIGDEMERSPDMNEQWSWYNTNHSTEGVDSAVGKILDQFKGLGETQRKKEAHSVGSVAATSLKGIYDIPGILDRQTGVPGYDRTDNISQIEQRKGLVAMDQNMLHGLEQGYLSYLKQNNYLDHREGSVLSVSDGKGSREVKPSGDKYIVSGKGALYENGRGMALSFDPSTALFDSKGRPNANYYKGFEDYVTEKLNFAAAGFTVDKNATLMADSTSSFRPLDGDALEQQLRKQRLDALLQSGLYTNPLADQVVTDGARDLDRLTGNGKAYNDMNEEEKTNYGRVLQILTEGKQQGFIAKLPDISSGTQLQEYLRSAPKEAINWLNLELSIAGLPPVARAYQDKQEGVEGEFGTSRVSETPTTALNAELMYATRQRYRMGNDETLVPKDKMGAMPYMLGNLPKDPRNLPDGAHFELSGGFVLNAQSARVDAAGNFLYDQPAGSLDYLEDMQRFQFLSQLAADPEKYREQFGNWGPIKNQLSTALVASQGTMWIPKEQAQQYIDETLVWAPKEWAHSKAKLEKISNEQAAQYARDHGLPLQYEDYQGKETSGKKAVYVADGKKLTGQDAYDVVKSAMLDEKMGGGAIAPGTSGHAGQRKTMKGGKSFPVKTVTTKTVNGTKVAAYGPTITLKGDDNLLAAYGTVHYKMDASGQEYIGFESRMNNNDVLELDADMLQLLYARERERSKSRAANGNAPKSKVIIYK